MLAFFVFYLAFCILHSKFCPPLFMSWLLLSLLSAFSLATNDALTKKFFSRLTPFEMGLVRLLYTLPWLLLALFWIPRPELDRTFWAAVAIALPLELAAVLAYMKALKSSPLSLSLPFLAFTPLFILLTGWVILGEKITSAGLGGIALIVVGSYCLNFSHSRAGWGAPWRAVFREPGSRLMLLVAFLYAFTSILGKLAIIHSHPFFFPVVYYLLLCGALSLFLPFNPSARSARLIEKPALGIVIGLLGALSVFSHMLAISQTQAVYMISVKRTSLLFGVLYGAQWFQEEKIRERLWGTILMVSGVFLIGWKG
jgi:drug/metabolite transporter (DMT)-like permease